MRRRIELVICDRCLRQRDDDQPRGWESRRDAGCPIVDLCPDCARRRRELSERLRAFDNDPATPGVSPVRLVTASLRTPTELRQR